MATIASAVVVAASIWISAAATPIGTPLIAPQFAIVDPSTLYGPHIGYNVTPEVQSLYDQLAACPPLPPRTTPPTNVRDVRPDDITVVIGMGDSITAGLNTRYLYHDLFSDEDFRNSATHQEFRGTNFVNGNDDDSLSIGKIITGLRAKQGRSGVNGLARGTTHLSMCFGPVCPAGTPRSPFVPKVCGLNAAQPGALVTQSNINNQFKYLDLYYDSFVPKHQKYEPWKLLIYDAGFNNLCLACNPLFKQLGFTPEIYENNVRWMMEQIRSRYSNIIVTLLGPTDLSQVQKIISADPICKNTHGGSIEACFCVFYKPEITGPEITQLAREYNERLAVIAAEYKAKNYDNFAVVYDAGLAQLDILNMPVPPNLSGVDCYHPSVSFHARNAVNLWNNMFLPDHKKLPYSFDLNIKLKCPSPDDRISVD